MIFMARYNDDFSLLIFRLRLGRQVARDLLCLL
jgi:hypothetical protein